MNFQDGDYVQIVGHMGDLIFTPSWRRIDGLFHRYRRNHEVVELYTDEDVVYFIAEYSANYDYIAVMREGDVIYG